MHEFIVIIPAFNEEESLGDVIRTLKGLNGLFDIVIVNDGSTDRTEKIAKDEGVAVVSHPTNLGYSSAIQTGFKYATKKSYKYIIFCDADGQHDPSSLVDMMREIGKGNVDVVIGSRFLRKGNLKNGFSKVIAIRLFSHIIYFATKKRITDPTSGLKAYNAKVFDRFAKADGFYYDLPDSNFIIDLLMNKYKIVEIPVNMFERVQGKSKIHQKGIKPFIYMAQMLLSIFVVILKNRTAKTGGS